MPDKRQHRGRHPADDELFAPDKIAVLREAVADLSWLFSRGYSQNAAVKLVGDRYNLRERQRTAVLRCACSNRSLAHRHSTVIAPEDCAGREIAIDGYNVLITVESALGGGVLLIGRDGCCRDLASLHGTYKAVEETRPALELIGRFLADLGIGHATWYLDSPVSNSGRLAHLIRELATANDWPWLVELLPNVDAALQHAAVPVATADSVVLDGSAEWVNLARYIVEQRVPGAQPLQIG